MLLRTKLSKGRYTYKLDDCIRKIWVGNDFQKKRKESTKIKKGSGEMEEEDVEEKS